MQLELQIGRCCGVSAVPEDLSFSHRLCPKVRVGKRSRALQCHKECSPMVSCCVQSMCRSWSFSSTVGTGVLWFGDGFLVVFLLSFFFKENLLIFLAYCVGIYLLEEVYLEMVLL